MHGAEVHQLFSFGLSTLPPQQQLSFPAITVVQLSCTASMGHLRLSNAPAVEIGYGFNN
jgi:hypothetical protein